MTHSVPTRRSSDLEGPQFQMPPNMPPDDHESIDGCGRAQCATEDSALQALDRRRPLSGGDAERRQVLADEVTPRWSREAPGHRCVSGDLAEAGAGRGRPDAVGAVR